MKKLFCLLLLPSLYITANEATYWENQFSDKIYTTPQNIITTLAHHSQQNIDISTDFVKEIMKNESSRKLFNTALKNVSTLLEVGCGSGEMLQLLTQHFPHIAMLGLDISHTGIEYANKRNNNENIIYQQFDCLNNNLQSSCGNFQIAICSNTLEHFKQPLHFIRQHPSGLQQLYCAGSLQTTIN